MGTGKLFFRLWQLPHPALSRGAIIISLNSEAVVMTYDEKRYPEIGVFKEIAGTWIFAISLVGVVLIVLGLFV